MIAAIYARSLIAALGLLALATTASADCAWVLWAAAAEVEIGTGTVTVAPGAWSPIQGFTTGPACETVRIREVDEERGRWMDREASRPGWRPRVHLPLPPRHRGPAWAEGEVSKP